jgi:hypothetical protein
MRDACHCHRCGETGHNRLACPNEDAGWLCKEPGCVNAALARGWCQKHYRRWRRNGTLATQRTVRCTECKSPNHNRATCA